VFSLTSVCVGCVFPPDQTDFLAGQFFDIRLEVHAPINGSEASHGGVPDTNFTLTIQKDCRDEKPVTSFFNVTEAPIEKWTFNYYEGKSLHLQI